MSNYQVSAAATVNSINTLTGTSGGAIAPISGNITLAAGTNVSSIVGTPGTLTINVAAVGIVDSVVAGANISVNNTDPVNPVVSVSGTTQNAIQIGNASGSLTSLGVANNSILVTGGTGIPSLSTTLPSAVQSNITQLGPISALTVSQAVVTDASKNLISLAYTNANTASTLVQRDGSGNFSAGTITANLTGTASSATTSTTSTNSTVTSTTTNATFYPAFMSATSGNLGINVNSSLTYNPSTTTLSVPIASHVGSSASLITPLTINNANTGGVSFSILSGPGSATISLAGSASSPLTFATSGAATGFSFGGAITQTSGNFTISAAASGLVLNPTTASGASPQTCNGRVGRVTFTGVSIAAGATQSFVINNSAIPAIATVISYSMTGATAGAALSIVSVTNVANTSSTIVVTNATGATTSTANITFNFLLIN